MDLDDRGLIDKVMTDLRRNGADTYIIATVLGEPINKIRYSILAEFGNGEKWEISDIAAV